MSIETMSFYYVGVVLGFVLGLVLGYYLWAH